MRYLPAATLVTLGLTALPPATAQDLSSRIESIRDGTIRLSVETRPEICGDGRSIGEETEDGFVLYTSWDRGFSISRFDYWAPDCNRGPLRIVVEKSAGQVTDLRVAVGVAWRSDAAGTDLGMVSGAETAQWLLDRSLSNREDVSRVAFLAANAVRDGGIADRLLAMVRDRDLPSHVRQGAMRWVNGAARREGKADTADRALRDVAASSREDRAIRDRAVRQIRSTPENDAYLRDLYRRASSEIGLRDRILRRLGDTDGAENAAWVRGVALDRNEPTDLRDRALRVIAEHTGASDLREIFNQVDQPDLKERVLRLLAERGNNDDRTWLIGVALDTGEPLSVRDRAIRVLAGESPTRLRELYSRLDHVDLRERVLRTAGEAVDSESTAWLRAIVMDANEHRSLRERALRVLGERDRAEARRLFERVDVPELKDRALRIAGSTRDAETLTWLAGVATGGAHPIEVRDRALRLLAEQPIPSTDLASLYDRLERHDLRQRVIRLLADRSDDDAVAKLINIAETDPDRDMRRYAIRRLGDSNHPRARAYLENAVRP